MTNRPTTNGTNIVVVVNVVATIRFACTAEATTAAAGELCLGASLRLCTHSQNIANKQKTQATAQRFKTRPVGNKMCRAWQQ